MKRPRLIPFILTLALFTLSSAVPFREEYRIRTVVIDAGHGGHDSGCLGASAKEKHVALAIALRLGKLIEDNYPDVKVLYTRKTDVFIPLHERANIANKAKADLFICIHLNSGGKAAYGVETYVMGNHKSEDNLHVAKRENSAILLEEDYKQQYDGFDPNSPEGNIIFTLFQSQFQHQSLLFASKVQDHVSDYGGRYNRGVKQAGFLVLYRTTMPAVLIECGFLTHDLEERFLNSEKGQGVMANSLYRAFREYKLDMETPGEQPSPPVASTSNNPAPKPAPAQEKPAPSQEKPVPAPVKSPEPLKPKSETITEEPKSATSEPVSRNEPVAVKSNPPAEKPVETHKEPEKTIPEAVSPAPAVFISIQVGASMKPETDNAKFMAGKGVKAIRCSDGYTRYVMGNYSSIKAATADLQKVKSNGTKDAFLTGFNGNQRISAKDAEMLIQKP